MKGLNLIAGAESYYDYAKLDSHTLGGGQILFGDSDHVSYENVAG